MPLDATGCHRRGSSSAGMLLQAYDSGQGDRKVVRFDGLPLAGLARVSHRVCEAHAEPGKNRQTMQTCRILTRGRMRMLDEAARPM